MNAVLERSDISLFAEQYINHDYSSRKIEETVSQNIDYIDTAEEKMDASEKTDGSRAA